MDIETQEELAEELRKGVLLLSYDFKGYKELRLESNGVLWNFKYALIDNAETGISKINKNCLQNRCFYGFIE